MAFTSSLNFKETLTQEASGSLTLLGSGSTGRTDLFTVNGNNGTLFSVSDDLSNSLFSVNTIAGLPVIEAFANNTVVMGQYGQNVLVVTGSSVGIKTSTPAYSLDVSGSGNYSNNLTVTGSLILNGSDISTLWTPYVPKWTAVTTNPVIGNGIIRGFYKIIGKTCFVRGYISMGSTTTYGSGVWFIGLPLAAPAIDAYAIQLPVSLLDNGTAWYSGLMNGGRNGSTTLSEIQVNNSGTNTTAGISPTFPFTWGDTDELSFAGSYEIA